MAAPRDGDGITRARRPAWRSPRVGVLLLLLSALFFSVNFAQEWWASHQVQQQAVQLQQKIDAATAQNARLQQQLSYYSSKQYVISQARVIGMGRPGDTLLVVNQGPARVRTIYVHAPAQVAPHNIFTRLLHALFH